MARHRQVGIVFRGLHIGTISRQNGPAPRSPYAGSCPDYGGLVWREPKFRPWNAIDGEEDC
jgi:hypothetical protein